MKTMERHVMDDMRDHFDRARERPSDQDLEELRQNYFIQARMQGSDDSSIGGLRVNQSGRKGEYAAAGGKAKRSSIADDLLFFDMLEQKYGVDFAENWAAELLDEETYAELMKIEDQDERRAAIAEAIIEGVRDGTIDPETIDNPDLLEWLNRHSAKYEARAEAAAGNTQAGVDHELTVEGNEEAALDAAFSNRF